MLKYIYCKEVFSEVPGEISLGISISGCQIHCKGCHSRELWEDKGTPLTIEELQNLLDKHKGITCVCFMGNGASIEGIKELDEFSIYIHSKGIKTALYTGYDRVPFNLIENFDFVKFGPYKIEYGGLDDENTNQRFYIVRDRKLWDYTPLFWKNYKMVYPDYFISNKGKLWSSHWGNFISPCLNEKGYEKVKIKLNGKYLSTFIHRLVAIAFIPNPHNLPQVNHINEIKTDNRVENLEWCTNEYNHNYGHRNIKSSEAMMNKNGEPIVQLSLNGNYIKEFTSPKEAERLLGHNGDLIRLCCKGGTFNKKRNKFTPIKTAYGFVWKFKKDYINNKLSKNETKNIYKEI